MRNLDEMVIPRPQVLTIPRTGKEFDRTSMTPENATGAGVSLATSSRPNRSPNLKHTRTRTADAGARAASAYPGLNMSTPDRGGDDAALLTEARARACDNLTAAMIGDVPVPPGAQGRRLAGRLRRPAAVSSALRRYRTVAGPNHTVQISTAAIQFADGSIDDGDIEPPSVAILDGDTDTGIQLNADQARNWRRSCSRRPMRSRVGRAMTTSAPTSARDALICASKPP